MDKDFLYVSDLDGTLLLPDGSFPQDFERRLNRLINLGMRFTIATARNYDSVHPILNGLNLNLPVILFNGVYLTDFDSGHILKYSRSIEKTVIETMLELALPRGINPFIYTFEEKHKLYYHSATNPGSHAYIKSLENNGRLNQVKRFEFQEEEKISGFLLIDRHDRLEPVYQSLREKYSDHLNLYFTEDMVATGCYWLQSFHREASKGNMLKVLAQQLKIPKERIVVFGDNLNDIDMFQVAGHAVAVENALPEVKESADEIIGGNFHGSVLQYLEPIFLEK